jgi:four helix bundle protein
MYLYDLVWQDCQKLRKDFRGRAITQQIIRSSGSICANQEEAYGRGLGTADYIRILRIALGEARETQGWYFRSRHLLDKEVIKHRTKILDQIIALLVTNIQSHTKNLAAK